VRGVAEGLLGRPLRQRFHFVPHHLAHAASAYFPSGFDGAAILTIDGLGEVACSTLAKAVGTHIQSIETFDFPHSLGFVWEVICGHLGFSSYDASKLMGLAAYGNPEVFRREFQSIMRVGKEDYAVDPEAIGFQSAKSSRIQTLLGPPRYPEWEILPRHADIAAALQAATNAAVTALVRRLKRKVPLDNLCFAGGVALNCVTNELVKQSGDFSDVFIPSAPHDAGTAVGAAFVVHCAKQKSHPERGNSTPFLGPAFDRREILAAVKSAGLTLRRSKAPARDAAEMIADGKIVAWFQGRMEFGPRALGNRSLLADPRRPDMRDILNQKSSTARTSGRLRRALWPNAPTNGSRLAPTRRVTNSCCLHVRLRPSGVIASLPSCTRTAGPGCSSCDANQIRTFTSSYPVSLREPACRSSSIRPSMTASQSSARPPTRSSHFASLAWTPCLWTMSI
jgi:carbamoyltransferase